MNEVGKPVSLRGDDHGRSKNTLNGWDRVQQGIGKCNNLLGPILRITDGQLSVGGDHKVAVSRVFYEASDNLGVQGWLNGLKLDHLVCSGEPSSQVGGSDQRGSEAVSLATGRNHSVVDSRNAEAN